MSYYLFIQVLKIRFISQLSMILCFIFVWYLAYILITLSIRKIIGIFYFWPLILYCFSMEIIHISGKKVNNSLWFWRTVFYFYTNLLDFSPLLWILWLIYLVKRKFIFIECFFFNSGFAHGSICTSIYTKKITNNYQIYVQFFDFFIIVFILFIKVLKILKFA